MIVAAFLLEAIFLALLWVWDWNARIPAFLTLYLSAFAVYLFVVVLVLRNTFQDNRRTARIIFIAAVVFRFTVVWCPPTLSEDFYRYVWDGKVQKAGINPYLYPPEATELQHLRDENHEKINYKRFRTPYPPFAELAYYAMARVSTNPYFFKFIFLLLDITLIECLRRLLIKERRSSALLMIYAWHPLAVVEFSGSSHMDIIGLSALAFALLLAWQKRHVICGVILAAACFTKYLPAIALPWLIRNGRWKFAVAFAGFSLLLLAWYYDPQMSMLQGVSVYYRKWRFNDFLFGFFYKLLGGAEPARRFGAVVALLTLAYCYMRRYSVYRSLFSVIGVVLLLSPVVHPWYVCWIIPFLVFHPNRAWIFFSGWIGLSYLIRYIFPTGLWLPIPQLQWMIYGPFFALLLWDFIQPYILLRRDAVKTY